MLSKGLLRRIKIEGKWPISDVRPVSMEFETAKAALKALRQYQAMGLQDIRVREGRSGRLMRLSEGGLRYWCRRKSSRRHDE